VAHAQLEFLSNILNQADPGEQIKPSREFEKHIKLTEVLNRAAGRVGEHFTDQPLVEAALRHTLGRTYYGLGEFQKARQHLERAEQLRRQQLGEKDPLRVESLNQLGWVYSALDLSLETESTFKTVLALRESTLGPDHADTLKSRYTLVMWDVVNDRLDKTDTRLRDILQAQQKVLPVMHRDILITRRSLADVYAALKRYDEAEKLYRQTVEEMRATRGRENPDTLNTMNNLGVLYLDRGDALAERGEKEKARQDYLRAEALFQELTKISERVQGNDHTEHLKSLQNLAAAYQSLGKYPDALEITRRVLERHEAVLGKTHEDTIAILAGQAAILVNSGKPKEAESLLLDAWKRSEGKPLPPDKREFLYDSLIKLYERLGDQNRRREWQDNKAVWNKQHPN
jgi:tetratricopeptide (TPR) repeat protein